MKKKNCKKPSQTLDQWMEQENYSDAGLGKILDVRRQTVWRWRIKGFLPHHRERKAINVLAGKELIFGV